jgi:hypothetical protein
MVCSCQTRGQGLPLGAILSCRCSRRWCLSGDVKPPGLGYLVELTALVPALPNLTWGKSFLPGDAYPMAESSWHLGVYSCSCCCIRRRWDGSSTWVHTIKCVWAPVATSLHARFLWPPLPEVLGSAMLIHLWEAPGCIPPGTRVPTPGQRDRWDGSQVAKSWLPALIVGWRSDGMDYSRDWFFLSWWPLLLSLVWWGYFSSMGSMVP